ncbi:MAG: hypothetical protein ACOVP1_01865 [Bacteroidia bacterium]
MKQPVLSSLQDYEVNSIEPFHSDLYELIDQLHLIYKSREGIIHPKFGFCKGLLIGQKKPLNPFKINIDCNGSKDK